MDDRTYLLGKLAALESALEAAISAHPEPGVLTLALCHAMARQAPPRDAQDVRGFADGWLDIVTPLLASHAKDVAPAPARSRKRRIH